MPHQQRPSIFLPSPLQRLSDRVNPNGNCSFTSPNSLSLTTPHSPPQHSSALLPGGGRSREGSFCRSQHFDKVPGDDMEGSKRLSPHTPRRRASLPGEGNHSSNQHVAHRHPGDHHLSIVIPKRSAQHNCHETTNSISTPPNDESDVNQTVTTTEPEVVAEPSPRGRKGSLRTGGGDGAERQRSNSMESTKTPRSRSTSLGSLTRRRSIDSDGASESTASGGIQGGAELAPTAWRPLMIAVRSQSWCHLRLLASLRRARCRLFVNRHPEMSDVAPAVSDLVAAHPYLAYFPTDHLASLIPLMKLRVFLPSEVLYYKGTRNDGALYWIVSGGATERIPKRKSLSMLSGTTAEEEVPPLVSTAMKCLGVVEMLTGDPRGHTAVADAEHGCIVLEISRIQFFSQQSSGEHCNVPLGMNVMDGLGKIREERVQTFKKHFRSALDPMRLGKQTPALKAWGVSGLTKLIYPSKPHVTVLNEYLCDFATHHHHHHAVEDAFGESCADTKHTNKNIDTPRCFLVLTGVLRLVVSIPRLVSLCGADRKKLRIVLPLVMESIVHDACLPLSTDRPRMATVPAVMSEVERYLASVQQQEEKGKRAAHKMHRRHQGYEVSSSSSSDDDDSDDDSNDWKVAIADCVAPCLVHVLPVVLAPLSAPRTHFHPLVSMKTVSPMSCAVAIDPWAALRMLHREDQSLVRSVCLQMRESQIAHSEGICKNETYLRAAMFSKRTLNALPETLQDLSLIELLRPAPFVLSAGERHIFTAVGGEGLVLITGEVELVPDTDNGAHLLEQSMSLPSTAGQDGFSSEPMRVQAHQMIPPLPVMFLGTRRPMEYSALTQCTGLRFQRSNFLRVFATSMDGDELNYFLDHLLHDLRRCLVSLASANKEYSVCGDGSIDHLLSHAVRDKLMHQHGNHGAKKHQQGEHGNHCCGLSRSFNVSPPSSTALHDHHHHHHHVASPPNAISARREESGPAKVIGLPPISRV